MSSKLLQTFLTLLKRQPVQASNIVSFLENDENTSILGLDSLVVNIKSLGDENIPTDVVSIMEKQVQLIINQRKEQAEEKTSRAIVENNFTNYEETITTTPIDLDDRRTINSYQGQTDGTSLNYRALYCPTQPCKFILGDLLIKLTHVSPISFKAADGSTKTISYKFQLDITHVSDHVGVEKEFQRIKMSVLHNMIGMSFLKPADVVTTKSTQLIVMKIDTTPFFKTLINSYNVYYNNQKLLDGTRLSEVTDIETCKIDSNGLILVPSLFYQSSIYTDGHLDGRPYIWAPNKAAPRLNLMMNRYRINISPPKGMSKSDIEDGVVSFCCRLAALGIRVSTSGPNDDSKSKAISIDIEDYNTYSEDNQTYQSSISSKLNLEAKVSTALRLLCRQGFLSIGGFLSFNTRSTTGSENYTFMFDKSTKTISSSYSRDSNNFMVYFNRSIIYSRADEENEGNPVNLVNAIIERNDAKANNTSSMIEYLNQNGGHLLYRDEAYPSVPGDYIPTSFIPIYFEKTDKRNGTFNKLKYLGISFIPFGFVRYVSTDMNVSGPDSALAIYGSDFTMEPVEVRRVLRLNNNPDKITNVFQIVVESKTKPHFIGDQPLLNTRLDDTHFLSLFRSTDNVVTDTDVNWIYSSGYVENMNINATDLDETTTISLTLNPDHELKFSKRAFLRYATENLGSGSEFTSVLLNNEELIFGTEDSVDLVSFVRLFTQDGGLSVSSLSKRFFELFETAARQGTINENVIASIMAITGVTDESVSNFIRSIQIPVKRNEYPIFDTQMQIDISNTVNRDIEDVVNLTHRLIDSGVGMDGSKFIGHVSDAEGLYRVVVDLIGQEIGNNISTHASLARARTNVLNRIKDLAAKPVLPSMVGRQIDVNFIKHASSALSGEIFVVLIKYINAELSADSYEDLIRTFLQRGTRDDLEIVITTISPYRYTITLESHMKKDVMAMDGEYLPELGYDVLLCDERCSSYEFGKQIYDHNIHAMFELDPLVKSSVNEIIVNSLQNGDIYYKQFDGNNLKTDLSLVSLYGIAEKIDDVSNFFLPYIHNGARLTVSRTSWTTNMAIFKLLTKTVEIEFRSDTDMNSKSISRACRDIIEFNNEDNLAIRSIIISHRPVQKTYTYDGYESHYFFTSDVSQALISGAYNINSGDDSIISQNAWKDMIGDELEISIHPVSPTIVKQSVKTVSDKYVGTLLKGYKFENPDKMNLTPSDYLKMYKSFILNPLDAYTDQFLSYGNVRSTMLITRNKRGIYTTAIGSIDTESRIAKGNFPYNPNHVAIDMSEVDELTFVKDGTLKSIEERILQSHIDLENSKRDEENVKHNLGLILSTIRWNTKQIENYKFINSERPKWIRFSPDSYFMAIAFESGVKIYIASGDQYVFCSNLSHEGVSEITFGNNNLCVTTQFQASDKPFSKLWFPASGVQLNQELNYYTVVDGDAANIKYITSSTNKVKKNQTITVTKDGKVYFGNIEVQSSTPIFNHNVYFFSPNDDYMIFNEKGTFSVLCVNEINSLEDKYVKFQSINGSSIDTNRILVKPIESGVWISETVFMGYSYNENNPLTKTRVIIDVVKKSIFQTDVIHEFPTMISAESMVMGTYTKVHPLYTHLMNEKKNYTDVSTGKVGQDGIWLWDLYISLIQKNENTWLNFNTTDGLHFVYKVTGMVPRFIDGVNDDGQNIPDYIITILKIMEVESISDDNGEHVKSLRWIGEEIFNRDKSERKDNMVLQCIDGNYFAFYGSSVYIWTYRSSKSSDGVKKIWTELSHVDSTGYERMTFEDYHVAIMIGSTPNAGIIYGDQLEVRSISLKDEVSYDVNPSDITSIVKPIKEKYTTDYFATTVVTFENYSNADITNPVTLDSRPISSAMCLNRFSEYTTKSCDYSRDNVFTHDNLLIKCSGNVVTIVPKTVPVSNTLDGLTYNWYKNHDDSPSNWAEKKWMFENYISKSEQIIPLLKGKQNGLKLNTVFINQIMATRTVSNFSLGINELRRERFRMPDITDQKIEEIIEIFTQIFNVFGNVTYITNPDRIIEAVDDYWNIDNSDRPFGVRMNSIKEDKKREEYNKLINLFSRYTGDNYLSYTVGMAFKKFRELSVYKGLGSRTNHRNIEETKKIIDVQINATKQNILEVNPLTNLNPMGIYIDPYIIDSLMTIKHILMIPLEKVYIGDINTYTRYSSRFSVMKGELSRISSMSMKNTKYDVYRAVEKSQLETKFREYMIKKLTVTSKVDDKHLKSDYFNCLTARYVTIPTPETIKFGDKNHIVMNDMVYVNAYATVTSIPFTEADIQRLRELDDLIIDIEAKISKINDQVVENSLRQIGEFKREIATLTGQYNSIIERNNKFKYTDGTQVNVMPLETFKVMNMKNVIKDVYNAIYKFLNEKVFNLVKNGFNISTLIGVIDGRKIKKNEVEIEGYAKQFRPYIQEEIGTAHSKDDISVAIVDFIDTMIAISSDIKSFSSVSSLYDLLSMVFEKRFPESLYGTYNEIPDRMLEIINKSEQVVSLDEAQDILDVNIPHINDFYNFYSDSLKKGHYLNDGSYNRDMDEIKKRMLPLIWKYRQGVCGSMIPVIGLKITFKRPVTFEPTASHRQRETDDLKFKYLMDDDKVKHGETQGEININLVDIISSFENRCNDNYSDNSGVKIYDVYNHSESIEIDDDSEDSVEYRIFEDPTPVSPRSTKLVDNNVTVKNFITEMLIRPDGSSNIGERIKVYDSNSILSGIKNDCEILKDAIEKEIITEKAALKIITNDMPAIDFDDRNRDRVAFESVDQYNDLFVGTYGVIMLHGSTFNKYESEKHINYIENVYTTRPQFNTFDTDVLYKFNYVRPGLEFDRAEVSVIYENKESTVVKETINMQRKNIRTGTVRPYSVDAKILMNSDNTPYIYKDSNDESYVIWYGNTIVGNITRAYIVTQKLSDRTMKTYFYVKYDANSISEAAKEAHAMKLFYNYRNNQNTEFKRREIKSFITRMTINPNGDVTYVEKVDDRKHVKGVGYSDVEIEVEDNKHIASLLNSWVLQDDITEKKFSSAIIESYITKTHGNKTITVSNYRAGYHTGSVVEIFELIDEKIICTANWNFHMFDVKNFDFSNKELFLVGTVATYNGYNVRIGVMDLTKRSPEKKAIFVTVFDNEINLNKAYVENLETVFIDTKDTTFIVYDDGKSSNLITINNKTTYEKNIDDVNFGRITSMRPSTKNGYVALYFGKIDRTMIMNCDGTLYQNYDGECNWM